MQSLSMTAARGAILRLFGVSHNRATTVEPLAAIFPVHAAPVVRLGVANRRTSPTPATPWYATRSNCVLPSAPTRTFQLSVAPRY